MFQITVSDAVFPQLIEQFLNPLNFIYPPLLCDIIIPKKVI
jgi:hypothetical protein